MSEQITQEMKAAGVAQVLVILKPDAASAPSAVKANIGDHFTKSEFSISAAVAATTDGISNASVQKMRYYPNLGVCLGTVDRDGLAALRADKTNVEQVSGTPPIRARGVIALREDNCTACMLCARSCPDWCIYIEAHKYLAPPRREGGKPRQRNELDRFDIDYSLCMYCGICVEVCPFDALFWSPEYEYSEPRIADLLHELELQLLHIVDEDEGLEALHRRAKVLVELLSVPRDDGQRLRTRGESGAPHTNSWKKSRVIGLGPCVWHGR